MALKETINLFSNKFPQFRSGENKSITAAFFNFHPFVFRWLKVCRALETAFRSRLTNTSLIFKHEAISLFLICISPENKILYL